MTLCLLLLCEPLFSAACGVYKCLEDSCVWVECFGESFWMPLEADEETRKAVFEGDGLDDAVICPGGNCEVVADCFNRLMM